MEALLQKIQSFKFNPSNPSEVIKIQQLIIDYLKCLVEVPLPRIVCNILIKIKSVETSSKLPIIPGTSSDYDLEEKSTKILLLDEVSKYIDHINFTFFFLLNTVDTKSFLFGFYLMTACMHS